MPSIFWQILRPFVPSNQDFERAFAETFALPEFRAIGTGGSRACSKMLQILASYREVPEQTAMKLLTNDLLLEKLNSEHDDVKFAQQVEAAFIEENRNLLEEKAALEQELIRIRSRAENELRQRRNTQNEFHKQREELSLSIADAEKQILAYKEAINQHVRAATEASQRAEVAEKSMIEAQKEAKQVSERKTDAQKQAFRMSVIAGFALGVSLIVIFLVITNWLPWDWLKSHKNSLPLQIGFSATLLCGSMGSLVKAWRNWCWSVGVVALLLMLIPLTAK